MFSSTGLFKKISCPQGDQCEPAQQCLFSHEHDKSDSSQAETNSKRLLTANGNYQAPPEPTKKRRRLNSLSSQEQQTWQGTQNPLLTAKSQPAKAKEVDENESFQKINSLQISGTKRPISPPPLSRCERQPAAAGKITEQRQETCEIKSESLNPRMMSNPPASHSNRAIYLRKIHDQFIRLNSAIASMDDEESKTLHLSDANLIKLALDEEEKCARGNPSIYANIVKLRILALSKMNVAQWKLEKVANKGKISTQIAENEESAEMNLSPSEQISVLRHLTANRPTLKKYGFVLFTPTERDINSAKDGANAAQGWEQCDRCKSRFQVFSERRTEDGLLTSGGECTYHPGRIQYPENRNAAATSDKRFTCCNATVGSSYGCASAGSHVFKVESGARLASVCPFKEVPKNPNARAAVSFDCEMGYTTLGMELIRLTALSWPDEKLLLDVLVRPLGTILDLNTRYSGVVIQDFSNAVKHGTVEHQELKSKQLEVVDSPMEARELLFKLLSPSTVLVGHALENDLIATRVLHQNIADSAVLYPHPRGPPFRLSLKRLAKDHLNRNIQETITGHDPREDAETAGILVQKKVARQWKIMKKEGWYFDAESNELVAKTINGS